MLKMCLETPPMRVSFSAEIGRGPSLDPYPPAPQSHPHDPPRQTQARRAGNHLAAELAARTRELETVKWRQSVIEIGRPTLRVHDLGHTYASLARRAGADLRLLQKTMGASITVTAHI